jgi:hypothetical protein
MGRDLTCRATWKGEESRGKALLESDHVLFRGGFRVKLYFRDLIRVEAASGSLTLASPDGILVLELGPEAAKWAGKILHPPSRADKLGIKPGMRISVVGIDEPDIPPSGGARLTGCDLIFLGVARAEELADLARHRDRMNPEGALWIVYPKGRKEVTEVQVIEAGRAIGLKDVKVAGFSTFHTALKFVWPVSARGRK